MSGRMIIVVLWVAAFFLLGLSLPPAAMPVPPRPTALHERLVFAALDAGVPIETVYETAWRESRWRHYVDGRVIADPRGISYGMFGLNARYHAGAARMTEAQNIAAGVAEIARLWRRYKCARVVHRAYTMGEAGMRERQWK